VPVISQQASFVVLQRAYRYGYATEYLGWIFNRGEFLSATADAGLQLERELLFQAQLEIDGAPGKFAEAGFLFRAGG
jgi:hypothetical protein